MVTERVYNVPLRKGCNEIARHKKTKRAVAVLTEFLSRHMKQKDLNKVYIGKNLNKELWKHGIKKPPAQVKVVVIKEDNGDVKAELYGFKYDHKKKEQKEEKTEETKPDKKIAEKAAESKEKSTSTEKKQEQKEHESKDVHTHEEKHEHAAAPHEHPKSSKKKGE